MKQGFVFSALTLVALAGACQQQDAKAESSPARASAAAAQVPAANRTADEAAIRNFVTMAYRRYVTNEANELDWSLMTPEFLRAYRECRAVEVRWSRLNPTEGYPDHACIFGGTLVPGNGGPVASVVMRTLRSTIAWQGPNKVRVRVSMKVFEYTGETEYVDLILLRTANGWRIDDMANIYKDDPVTTYRADFVTTMAAMRREMGQR